MKTGKLITFEGIEKCGKSTLIEYAYDYLKGKNLKVVKGREPGGVEVAEAIRKILLNPEFKGKINERTELALFEAARSQYVGDFIIPNLTEGKIVLSDRYYDSSMAYQSFGRGIKREKIDVMNKFYNHGIIPDLTFIIDIPIEIMIERMEKDKIKKDRFEQEKIDFHERVRQGYLWIASAYKRCVLIDNSESIENAQKELKIKLDEFLEKYFK